MIQYKNIIESEAKDMADYVVSPMGWGGCFLVPADLVDRHLKLASPDAIRVLLYLLRHGQAHPDAEVLAEALGIDTAAASDALDYWVADGLLARAEEAAVVRRDETADKSSSPAVVIRSGKMPSYSGTNIRDAVKEHPELRQMFVTAEDIFSRQLTNADINLLYGLFDWYAFPADVIPLILLRCRESGKLRPAAITQEAENFYKNGAVTKEKADAFVAELREREAAVDETAALLRIADHSLYPKERKAFETWRFSYGFSSEIVAVALEVACRNTEQAAYSPDLLPYLNKVLLNWHKHGITSAEEAKELTEQKKAPSPKKESGAPHSYDLNEEAARAMKRFAGKKNDKEETV